MAQPAQCCFWNPAQELSEASQKDWSIFIPSSRYELKAQEDDSVALQIDLVSQDESSAAGFFVYVCDQNREFLCEATQRGGVSQIEVKQHFLSRK